MPSVAISIPPTTTGWPVAVVGDDASGDPPICISRPQVPQARDERRVGVGERDHHFHRVGGKELSHRLARRHEPPDVHRLVPHDAGERRAYNGPGESQLGFGQRGATPVDRGPRRPQLRLPQRQRAGVRDG